MSTREGPLEDGGPVLRHRARARPELCRRGRVRPRICAVVGPWRRRAKRRPANGACAPRHPNGTRQPPAGARRASPSGTTPSIAPRWSSIAAGWTAIFGIWMHDYFGHRRCPRPRRPEPADLRHARRRARRPPRIRDLRNLSQIIALVAAVRRQIASGGIEAYNDGSAEHPPRVTQLQNLSGVPQWSASFPSSATREPSRRRGARSTSTSPSSISMTISPPVFGDRYKIDGAAFQSAAASVQHGAALPLADPAGRFMSFFQWTPLLPGRDLLAQTLPVIGTAFLLGAIVTSILSHLLWRKSRALEHGSCRR